MVTQEEAKLSLTRLLNKGCTKIKHYINRHFVIHGDHDVQIEFGISNKEKKKS